MNEDDFSECHLSDLPDTVRFSIKEFKLMVTERLALLVELGLTNKSIAEVETNVEEFVGSLEPCHALDLLCSPPGLNSQVSLDDARRWAYRSALVCNAILAWPRIDEDALKTVLVNCRDWSKYWSWRQERYQEFYQDFSQMISMVDARSQ